MGVRTKVTIAVVVLLSVVGGLTWLYVHEAGGPRRPGDSVELPQTGPVVPTGRFQLIGGLAASMDRRCVYFQPMTDPQAYDNPPFIAVRWPEGFEGRIADNGDFVVLHSRGRVVAREGTIMGLAGRFAHGTSDDECLRDARIFEVTDVATRIYFAE
jgi:hypothetical protein